MVLNKSRLSLDDIFDKKATPFALSIFILACAYSGISAFLALYAKDLGMVKAASSFFIIYAIFLLVSRPFTGRWTDKFGAKVILYPCLILFTLGMLMLSKAHSTTMILLAGAFIGIGYGSVTPIIQTETINSVEPHRVGMASSLFFSSMDAGMALGAYILGVIADVYGYPSIYMVGMVLIMVAGIQYFALTKKKQIEEFTYEDEDIAV